MFMQNLRKATQKHRKLLIIVVVLLGASMVGTFASWNSNYDESSSSSDSPSTAEYIKMYENLVKEKTPAEGKPVDYGTATTLAQYYKQLNTYYYTAYTENQSSDEKLAKEYLTKSTNAITKAAEYYQVAIDNALPGLNNLGKAQLYANKAAALFGAGTDSQTVRANYQKAYELAPDNWDIAYSYSWFILSTDGLEKATAFLTAYKNSLPADSSTSSTVDQAIQYYKSLYQSVDNTESKNTSTSSNKTDSTSASGSSSSSSK